MIERAFKEEVEKIAGGNASLLKSTMKTIGKMQSTPMAIGGGAVGAVTGAATSDDSLSGALMGGAAGAGLGYGITKLVKSKPVTEVIAARSSQLTKIRKARAKAMQA